MKTVIPKIIFEFYNPQANRLVERYVQTFKKRFGATRSDGKNLTKSLKTFLFSNRIIPWQTTGRSPSEKLYRWQPHTKLTLLKRSVLGHIDKALVSRKSRWIDFKAGVTVWVRQGLETKSRERRMVQRTRPVSYIIEEDNRQFHRHGDQLRRRVFSEFRWCKLWLGRNVISQASWFRVSIMRQLNMCLHYLLSTVHCFF